MGGIAFKNPAKTQSTLFGEQSLSLAMAVVAGKPGARRMILSHTKYLIGATSAHARLKTYRPRKWMRALPKPGAMR
jgi:hypothetical protein